jgi:fatty-acyl-CoA synthase
MTIALGEKQRLSPAQGWLRALELTQRLDGEPLRTLPVVIEELAERFGDAPALLSDRQSFSFRTLAEQSNRYSRWALEQGLQPGETVGLLMSNCPEYLAVWLGITRVGATVALLNTNLGGAALAHCIAVATPRHLIVSDDLLPSLATAEPHLGTVPPVWCHNGTPATPGTIDQALAELSGAPLTAAERRPVRLADRALYIYTSGTTGLPKAANVSHHRVMAWSFWFAGMMDSRPEDRLYDCLPMYHSVGGIVATGSVLVAGGSVVIREKFSASRFWEEVVRWECTLFQYIGELCRYLLKAPVGPDEGRHRLRLCCGNGLRADVWTAFKERFAVPQILEFYAATEGNFSLYNLEGKPGAIGRIPSFLAHRFPAAIVRFDTERGAPRRDAEGRCERCARNEVGEAIGRISEAGTAAGGRFEGYTSQAETDKKVLRDVFAPGDCWFRTGDLMRQDEQGFFYFVDRIGDTFRWKGENVATSEVAAALAECRGVVEANVYGVTVPGADGRAGMAALVVDETFDLADVRAGLVERLPDYARPVFLRLQSELAVTETFKQKKQPLVEEGFDPRRIADALYYDDRTAGAYVRLDAAAYERIGVGEIRV